MTGDIFIGICVMTTISPVTSDGMPQDGGHAKPRYTINWAIIALN